MIAFIRRLKTFGMIVAGTCLIVMFQNFNTIPLESLRPSFPAAHASSPNDGSADIRDLAPYRAPASEGPMFVAPQGGSDVNAISQDWLSREAHLLTGGADERFLVDLNKSLNRMISSDESDDSPVKPAGAASRSSLDNSPDKNEPSILDGMAPRSLRLMSANRFQIGFVNRTELSCAVQGDGVQLNLTRPISDTFDFNLRHETSGSKSTFSFNYRW
jgi:hypothetical protein